MDFSFFSLFSLRVAHCGAQVPGSHKSNFPMPAGLRYMEELTAGLNTTLFVHSSGSFAGKLI